MNCITVHIEIQRPRLLDEGVGEGQGVVGPQPPPQGPHYVQEVERVAGLGYGDHVLLPDQPVQGHLRPRLTVALRGLVQHLVTRPGQGAPPQGPVGDERGAVATHIGEEAVFRLLVDQAVLDLVRD